MTSQKRALSNKTKLSYGLERVRAGGTLRGPANITLQQSSEKGFYGWPLLSLEAQEGRTDRIESRIIYANLFNEEQATAVLRSVYWDGEIARKAYRQKEQPFQLYLPARFVQMPTQQVREWLSQFDGASTIVNDAIGEDDTIIIRRLRIERDYKASVFEKIWQVQDESHAALNQRWNQVWQHMTESLSKVESAIRISDVDEDFWLGRPWVRYDMEKWQPNQLAIAEEAANRPTRPRHVSIPRFLSENCDT